MPAQLTPHEEINHSLAVQMQGFYRKIQADTSPTFRKNILDTLTSFTENYAEEFGFFDQAKLDALIFTNLIELNKRAADATTHFLDKDKEALKLADRALKLEEFKSKYQNQL